jgi:hypothetical protein
VRSAGQRVLLVLAVALAALMLAALLRYPGKAPVSLPAASCDASLWKHVYRPERLRVMEGCTAVEGRVVSVAREGDGDLHIALDPDDPSVLNLVNAMHAGRRLIVESVCDHEPEDDTARAACAGFHPEVTIPNRGDRIRVTGAYVRDRENGWNEIHPVTRIEILH